MDIIGRLWQDSPLFLTRAEFEATLKDCSIETVWGRNSGISGVFVIRGPELHFAKFDDEPIARLHLERLNRLIAEHGYALTRTPKDDERMLRFNKRLGFTVVGEDEFDIHLRIERLRGKELPCPSLL